MEGKGVGVFHCNACDMTFPSQHDIGKHQKDCLQTKEPQYRCPHCDKGFYKKIILRNHIMIHTDERPHPCPVCGQRFRRNHHMKRHLEQIHVNEKSPRKARGLDSYKDASSVPIKLLLQRSPGSEQHENGSDTRLPDQETDSSLESQHPEHTDPISQTENSSHVGNVAVGDGIPDLTKSYPSQANGQGAPEVLLHRNNTSLKDSNQNENLAQKFDEKNQSAERNQMLSYLAQTFPHLNTINGNSFPWYMPNFITVPPPYVAGLNNSGQFYTWSPSPLMLPDYVTTDTYPLQDGNRSHMDRQEDDNVVEASVEFPGLYNAWAGSDIHKCSLCDGRFESQDDLDDHFSCHLKTDDDISNLVTEY